MPEIGTSGSMSGERKRGDGSQSEPQATAPLLDSTSAFSFVPRMLLLLRAGWGQNCQSVDFVSRGWCRSTSGHLSLKLMSDAVRRSKFPCGVGTTRGSKSTLTLIVLARLVALMCYVQVSRTSA